MKDFLRLFVIFGAVANLAGAVSVGDLQHIHGIGRVEVANGSSERYLARTPYILRWNADPKYKVCGSSRPHVKTKSHISAIHVYDSQTGQIVHSLGPCSLSGETKVPVAGNHRVKIYCPGPWQASFEEDRAVLEAAARRGELASGKTVVEGAATSVRAKNEKVEALRVLAIQAVDEVERQTGKQVADELRRNAETAAHLASGEQDFTTRFEALTKQTLQNSHQATKIPMKKAATPAPTWDGKGLPPGMRKK